jgi:hypothetical protein
MCWGRSVEGGNGVRRMGIIARTNRPTAVSTRVLYPSSLIDFASFPSIDLSSSIIKGPMKKQRPGHIGFEKL